MSGQPVKLSDFGLDEKFGYMQHVDPVTTLPQEMKHGMRWEKIFLNI